MFSSINKSVNDRRNGIKSDEGFTLIELLVVVIIIGILAAIAIPVYLGIQNNAKDAAVKSDISNAKTAVVAHSTSADGVMPASLTALVPADGYTTPAGDNYGTTGSKPALTVNGTAFCIAAKSVTGTLFAASDTTGVAKGTCSTAAVFVPAA